MQKVQNGRSLEIDVLRRVMPITRSDQQWQYNMDGDNLSISQE